jgi:Mor family transcriptional regulator
MERPSMSSTTLMLRDLATAAASHPKIEQAVNTAIRTVLPDVIESILREQFPGEQVQFYVAKKPATMRRERDSAIRAEYNGRNAKALATKYGISARMVFNIVSSR